MGIAIAWHSTFIYKVNYAGLMDGPKKVFKSPFCFTFKRRGHIKNKKNFLLLAIEGAKGIIL